MTLTSIILLLQLSISLLSAASGLPAGHPVRDRAIDISNQAILMANQAIRQTIPIPATPLVSPPIISNIVPLGVPFIEPIVEPKIEPIIEPKLVSRRELDPVWYYYVQQSYEEESGKYSVAFWFNGKEGTVTQITMDNVMRTHSSRVEFANINFGFHAFEIKLSKENKFAIIEDGFEMQNTKFTVRIHPR